MTRKQIAEIRARADAATPGPWRWEILHKTKFARLVSYAGFRDTVMDFVRWGMLSAQPRFNVKGLMVKCQELLDVIPGREHHAHWAKRLIHTDADFIAYSRDDVPALCDALTEALDELEELREYISNTRAAKLGQLDDLIEVVREAHT